MGRMWRFHLIHRCGAVGSGLPTALYPLLFTGSTCQTHHNSMILFHYEELRVKTISQLAQNLKSMWSCLPRHFCNFSHLPILLWNWWSKTKTVSFSIFLCIRVLVCYSEFCCTFSHQLNWMIIICFAFVYLVVDRMILIQLVLSVQPKNASMFYCFAASEVYCGYHRSRFSDSCYFHADWWTGEIRGNSEHSQWYCEGFTSQGMYSVHNLSLCYILQ